MRRGASTRGVFTGWVEPTSLPTAAGADRAAQAALASDGAAWMTVLV